MRCLQLYGTFDNLIRPDRFVAHPRPISKCMDQTAVPRVPVAEEQVPVSAPVVGARRQVPQGGRRENGTQAGRYKALYDNNVRKRHGDIQVGDSVFVRTHVLEPTRSPKL
jgi:hypothetical protein